MSQSITTYNSKKRLVLSNGEAIRKMIIGSDWNVLRIGCLITSHAQANILGTPRFAMGACSGYQGYGSSENTGTNLIGSRANASSWTWTDNSGDSNVSIGGGSFSIAPFTRVGGTFTNGTTHNVSSWDITSRSDFAKRTALFVEITKGSPNFSVIAGGPNNATGGRTDITDAQFLEMMELTTLSQQSTVVSNYTGSVETPKTLAFDEANGELDSIFFFWNRTSPVLSLDAVAYRRMS